MIQTYTFPRLLSYLGYLAFLHANQNIWQVPDNLNLFISGDNSAKGIFCQHSKKVSARIHIVFLHGRLHQLNKKRLE